MVSTSINWESNNLIFETADKLIKDSSGNIVGTETVTRNRKEAKKIQSETDVYYQTQALKQEKDALTQVAKANYQLAKGEITAAEASTIRSNATAGLSDEVQALGRSEKTSAKDRNNYIKQQKAQITTNQKAAMSFKKLSASAVAMFKNLGAEMAFLVALQLAI